eukprot:2198175-Pleurochrysis_carterae.AAC.1
MRFQVLRRYFRRVVSLNTLISRAPALYCRALPINAASRRGDYGRTTKCRGYSGKQANLTGTIGYLYDTCEVLGCATECARASTARQEYVHVKDQSARAYLFARGMVTDRGCGMQYVHMCFFPAICATKHARGADPHQTPGTNYMNS